MPARKTAPAKGASQARRRRAPKKISVGASEVNASDLRGLREAWLHGSLVLFLGAGVSIPYGLPSWRDLVLEMLFDQTRNTRALGRLWPHYRRALAEWMTEYFDYNPLVLARMVEKHFKGAPAGDGFLDRLREKLYANTRTPPPSERTTLRAVADLIEHSVPRQNGVERVVTFNFDDLLEQELRARGFEHTVVTDEKRKARAGFKIIHPHGYIPREGEAHRRAIVFNETDYHDLTESVFHWGLSEIITSLRHSTVLFIGLSMSDPSLRRLLDAAKNSDIPPHWQIQKRHAVREADMPRVMEDVAARADRHAGHMSGQWASRQADRIKTEHELHEAIQGALRQADTYDREVYEGMGVKTIWIEDFADLPRVLDAIRQPPPGLG